MTTTTLLDDLSARFGAAFQSLGASTAHGAVNPSNRPELGQFQCNGAMAASKLLGKNPRDLATTVVAALQGDELVASLSIAGPGFINVTVKDKVLAARLQQAAADPRRGVPADPRPLNVVVDYGGPNVAKPMHVGHLRSTIIGDSIKRTFRFLGHNAVGDIHLGDWGTQMGMLIIELEQRQPDLPYFDAANKGPFPKDPPVSIADLQEMYPAISSRCKEDEALRAAAQQATVELQQGRPGYRALWRHFVDLSIDELKADFGRLGVHFELWNGESTYLERLPSMVAEMEAAGVAVRDQGALIIPVEEPGDKEPVAPLMLLKSDGGANYATTDLATIEQRVKQLRADLVLYVVDKRQSLHFKQVFRAAAKTGMSGAAVLEHLPFGTMNGKDGKPFKTREGGVMRLSDLIALMTDEARKRMLEADIASEYDEGEKDAIATKVGMAALKYADLMNMRTTDYVFDVERFTKFEGKTGAYLLYATVRAKSILRKAAERGIEPGAILPPTQDSERALFLALLALPEAVRRAAAERMPHHLCTFAYELASAYSRFLADCHILTEEDAARRAGWLAVVRAFEETMEALLGLLGIEVPQRM